MKGKVATIIAILFLLTLYGNAEEKNMMAISPIQKLVNVGENFTINVTIIPVEPVTSAVCNISFDASVLQAMDVSNGGIFEIWVDDFLFNLTNQSMIKIDNINGSIRRITGVSSAENPVTEPGIFAIITFKAVTEGISYINITNAFINQKAPNIVNGIVTVQKIDSPPNITFIEYPPNIINYGNVMFKWNATDDYTPWQNILFSYMLEGYENNWTPWEHVLEASYENLLVGGYTFMLKAKDEAGNIAYSNKSFTIVDNIPPTIKNIVVNPPKQEVGKYVNISCIIDDEFGIEEAKVIITYPDGSQHVINLKKSSIYYYNSTYNMVGTYVFYMYAKDKNGNENNSNIMQFEIEDKMPPVIESIEVSPSMQDIGKNVNISCIAYDNVGIENIFLNITYPDGKKYNFSIRNSNGKYYCNKPYSISGEYSFFIFAIDDSGNKNKSSVMKFEIVEKKKPFANFIYHPTNPVENEIIYFESDGYDIDGYIVNYMWNFGDGSIAYGNKVSHAYGKEGKYTVILTVEDNDGLLNRCIKSIEIRKEIEADFYFMPLHPSPKSKVYFRGNFSDGINATWYFGDGSFSYGKNATHVYEKEGNYEIKLLLYCNGLKKEITRSIVVALPELILKEYSYERKGGKIFLKATVENKGGYVKNASCSVFLNRELIDKKAFNISYNETKNLEFAFKLKKGKIKIFVDAENKIEEKDENNNSCIFYLKSNGEGNMIYYFMPLLVIPVIIPFLLRYKKKNLIIGEEREERCIVCFGKFKEKDYVKCRCGNLFHKSCAERIENCPTCGRKLK